MTCLPFCLSTSVCMVKLSQVSVVLQKLCDDLEASLLVLKNLAQSMNVGHLGLQGSLHHGLIIKA